MNDWISQGTLYAFGTAIAAVLLWVFKQGQEIGRMKAEAAAEAKLNKKDREFTQVLAKFQRRRGMVAAQESGMINTRTPSITLTAEWRRRLERFKLLLHSWYVERYVGRSPTDDELYWDIEEYLGDEIVRQVCEPYGLHEGQCLTAALLLCREASESYEMPTPVPSKADDETPLAPK